MTDFLRRWLVGIAHAAAGFIAGILISVLLSSYPVIAGILIILLLGLGFVDLID